MLNTISEIAVNSNNLGSHMSNEHDDDNEELESENPEEIIVYSLDTDTHELIEVACNCLVSLAEAQIHEESAQGLIAIADRLAERFSIGRLDQEIHTTDDGEEEVILRPGTSIFPDADDAEEGEAPQASE